MKDSITRDSRRKMGDICGLKKRRREKRFKENGGWKRRQTFKRIKTTTTRKKFGWAAGSVLTSTATWHELLPIGVFPRRQTVAAPDEDARPRRRLYITSCISSSRRNTYELTRSIGLRLDGISQLPPGWFSNDTRELKPFLACVNRVKPSLRQTVAAVGFNEGWPTFYLIIFTSRRAATLS